MNHSGLKVVTSNLLNSRNQLGSRQAHWKVWRLDAWKAFIWTVPQLQWSEAVVKHESTIFWVQWIGSLHFASWCYEMLVILPCYGAQVDRWLSKSFFHGDLKRWKWCGPEMPCQVCLSFGAWTSQTFCALRAFNKCHCWNQSSRVWPLEDWLFWWVRRSPWQQWCVDLCEGHLSSFHQIDLNLNTSPKIHQIFPIRFENPPDIFPRIFQRKPGFRGLPRHPTTASFGRPLRPILGVRWVAERLGLLEFWHKLQPALGGDGMTRMMLISHCGWLYNVHSWEIEEYSNWMI